MDIKTVKEVSCLTGVSVRTLHHYDAIGLLKPTRVTEAGYRLYDREALGRLHTILLLRELEFPLKEIKDILDRPDFDPVAALEQQIRLLELKRDHLEGLIHHAKTIQKTGAIQMNFKPFDKTQMDAYAAEAKAKWGKTDAYREYSQKTAGQTDVQLASTGADLMDLFRQLGAMETADPAAKEVQAWVAGLQAFITANYYTCTKQILRGLGQMYIAGDAMTENIEKAGGPGTAQLASEAIAIYCAEG